MLWWPGLDGDCRSCSKGRVCALLGRSPGVLEVVLEWVVEGVGAVDHKRYSGLALSDWVYSLETPHLRQLRQPKEQGCGWHVGRRSRAAFAMACFEHGVRAQRRSGMPRCLHAETLPQLRAGVHRLLLTPSRRQAFPWLQYMLGERSCDCVHTSCL